jgi:hypothetical protein
MQYITFVTTTYNRHASSLEAILHVHTLAVTCINFTDGEIYASLLPKVSIRWHDIQLMNLKSNALFNSRSHTYDTAATSSQTKKINSISRSITVTSLNDCSALQSQSMFLRYILPIHDNLAHCNIILRVSGPLNSMSEPQDIQSSFTLWTFLIV